MTDGNASITDSFTPDSQYGHQGILLEEQWLKHALTIGPAGARDLTAR